MRCLRLFLLALVGMANLVMACSVPVFRYALEHWAADPFQIWVFHQGALPVEMARALDAAEATVGARANLQVRYVDLDASPPAELLRLFELHPAARAPWLVVRYSASTGISQPVLSAPFQVETLARVLDSPTRREVARRLAAGQSAVWLLLESGDRAADDAAEQRLSLRLTYLAGVMALPKLDESDIANGLVSVSQEQLRLEFSVMRVARTDAAETALVRMLLLSEEGLEEVEGEPMVFPIFGQGRALYALVGEGIRDDTVEEAAAFLIGKCSCQVKEQNPGIDLLFKADWPLAAKGSFAPQAGAAKVPVQTPVTAVTSEPVAVTRPSSRWPLAAAVLLLALAGVWLLRR